ncbi:hypothetical protein ACWDAQ_15640, partial [Streptomyces sp. NPDC001139]
MTTQARGQKGAQNVEHRFHNAQGAEVKTRDEAFAPRAEVSPEAVEHLKQLGLHCDLGPEDRFFWY